MRRSFAEVVVAEGMASATLLEKLSVGNPNNLQLLHGEPERVELEARRAIAEAGPAFALCNQGPEIPGHVADEHIEALVRAAHRRAPSALVAA